MDDPRCGPITLYKAQRGFQESYPMVENVTANDNELTWNDNVYSYKLRIKPLPARESEP